MLSAEFVRTGKHVAAVAAAMLIAACASTPNAPSSSEVYDPWEGANRDLFVVYKAVDSNLVEPAALGYRKVTTPRVRSGVRNFLDNFRSPVILFNDLMQGEFKRAGVTFSRFAINTLVGFYGTFDPAERLGLEYHSEDFGQTMAVWGVPPGPFLMLPFFGPTSVRDISGRAVDTVMDPLFWLNDPAGNIIQNSRIAGAALSEREGAIEALADLEAGSLDYYVALRSVFMQVRRQQILNGRSALSDLPEIDEFDVEFENFE